MIAASTLGFLAFLEPDILGAPTQSTEATVFTIGGTLLAAIAFLVMLRLALPPALRLLLLGVPFVALNWWLLSPFFLDAVVDDEFAVTIADAGSIQGDDSPTHPGAVVDGDASPDGGAAAAAEPVLLGSGSFVGLAGHDGSGDAGVFALPEGNQVLRLENFDIDNGPDLKLYLVPGADQVRPSSDAVNLGALRGNVGDQTYDIPTGSELSPGPWSVLVWCERFAVEFVAATLDVT